MTCACTHPDTTHVGYTGGCGLCDCPAYREGKMT